MKNSNSITRVLIMSLLTLTFLFSACKKDDQAPTKTELLTQSLWKMTGYTMEPGFPTFDDEGNITGTTNDMFATMGDCEKDNTNKFNTDKTVVTDEGATKCDNSDPQKTTSTWSFNAGETVLTITDDGDAVPLTVLELTDKVLKLKFTETFDSETFSATITFSH
jgi:hypothetical protein